MSLALGKLELESRALLSQGALVLHVGQDFFDPSALVLWDLFFPPLVLHREGPAFHLAWSSRSSQGVLDLFFLKTDKHVLDFLFLVLLGSWSALCSSSRLASD